MTQTAGVRIPKLSDLPSLSGLPFPSPYDTQSGSVSPDSKISFRNVNTMGLPPHTPPSGRPLDRDSSSCRCSGTPP